MSKLSKEEALKAIEDILKQCGESDEKVELSTLSPRDTFMNARFVVLEQKDGIALVRDMADRSDRVFDEDAPDWKESELRSYLNTDVLKEYEELFGSENIVETETDLTTVDGQAEYGVCRDKVRLLTFMERREYQKLYEHSGEWEWTITPWSTKERGWEYGVCVVSPSGIIDIFSCRNNIAVRPFVSLKSNIFVSLKGEVE
jgi:hypothetical protein